MYYGTKAIFGTIFSPEGCFPLVAVGVKSVYLLNVWRPKDTCYSIERIPYFAGMFVLIGATTVPKFSLLG